MTAALQTPTAYTVPKSGADGFLDGGWINFGEPGPIGADTPDTGAFTDLTASGAVTFTDTTDSTDFTTAAVVMSGGLAVAKRVTARQFSAPRDAYGTECFGANAGYSAEGSGSAYMTLIGNSAGYSATTAYSLTAIGYHSGVNVSTAEQCTMLGYQSGPGHSSGYACTFLGANCGPQGFNSVENVAAGFCALVSNGIACNYSVALGNNTLANNSLNSHCHTAVGHHALENKTTGNSCIGLGIFAGRVSGTAANTLFVGDTTIDASAYAIDTVVIDSANAYGAVWTKPQTFGDRTYFASPNSAVTDADIQAASFSVYLDETLNVLKFRVKYTDGTTMKLGSLALV